MGNRKYAIFAVANANNACTLLSNANNACTLLFVNEQGIIYNSWQNIANKNATSSAEFSLNKKQKSKLCSNIDRTIKFYQPYP